MGEDGKLIGQISVVCSHDGWQVVTHVGFFGCQEEAYAVEVLEEHEGTHWPAGAVVH